MRCINCHIYVICSARKHFAGEKARDFIHEMTAGVDEMANLIAELETILACNCNYFQESRQI